MNRRRASITRWMGRSSRFDGGPSVAVTDEHHPPMGLGGGVHNVGYTSQVLFPVGCTR